MTLRNRRVTHTTTLSIIEFQLASSVISCTGSSDVIETAARYHLKLSKTDRYIMTVLPRVTEVDKFTDRVIALMGTEVISLSATENVSGSSVSSRLVPGNKNVKYSTLHSNLPLTSSSSDRLDMDSTAGGFCSELKFTLNCRVLLRRAIDQVKGLVNGLTGVLEEIDVVTGQVQKLGVRFDRLPDEVIWISRVTVMYTDNRRRMRSRTQFPLEPAAAVTIYNAQGLTLDNVECALENSCQKTFLSWHQESYHVQEIQRSLKMQRDIIWNKAKRIHTCRTSSKTRRFDRLPDEIIWVTRVTVMYTDNRRRMKSRTQFPLEPAAAVTIHKAQGLTLDNVIMKTSSIFANSQMYVGASRVKTMTGLHLIDFDATKILVDQAALAKYEMLRASTFP
ncbi:hypothetical protein GCK72_008182 [Caenorhabditis remanei]|uniref:ATP-dependent DNA helicase n=1 Tax=Caenorhabditis remanei TaxID=31234 RepID=A0A6A5GXW0_CAERE|nr:hypothetical protein GCK72_008182 [Caenorhabditis remanei]KAF1759937.1 hypothetical protein GCK72_008182 [Caenorhabditis remanei]